ncbi:MAG: LytR C-terminal domain-containing protein [Fibrobacterales bacterium]
MIRVLTIVSIFMLLACKEKPKKVIVPVPGEIQVLNACGMAGAADKMRAYLMENGYDVVETGNASYWNYKETIIAIRNKYWIGKEAIGIALKTENIVLMENSAKLIDATVFVGKDFEELIKDEE